MGSAGLTLTIAGGDRWTVPQRADEVRRMAVYVEAIGDVPGRCATCAFRPGTEANRSHLVLHLIEGCLVDKGSTFMCHTGCAPDGAPAKPCAGFLALRAVEVRHG